MVKQYLNPPKTTKVLYKFLEKQSEADRSEYLERNKETTSYSDYMFLKLGYDFNQRETMHDIFSVKNKTYKKCIDKLLKVVK